MLDSATFICYSVCNKAHTKEKHTMSVPFIEQKNTTTHKNIVNNGDTRRDRMMDYVVIMHDKGLVKPGEHWCSNMTLAEAMSDTKSYIKGTGWAGRTGFVYLADGTWEIKHIDDVSEHAKSIGKFYPNAKWDEASVFVGADTKRIDVKREVFVMSYNEYMSHRNKVIHNSGNIETYGPHEFQVEYANFRNERIISQYNSTGKAAVGQESVTRFGKTKAVYNGDLELIKDPRFPHNHMKTLIYTGKPKVENGWKRELNHVDYEGWIYKNSKIENSVSFEDNNTQEYIFASAQGNHKGKKQQHDSRIKHIAAQWQDPKFRKKHFCKLILEECHAYLMTESERKFIESLNPDCIEYVSGTMGDVLQSGIIDKDDVYRFSLVDAMIAKANNHPRFKDFPTPVFIVSKHAQVFVSENPENPNFAKALGWTGSQPIYLDDVDNIFTSLASDTGSRKDMPLLASTRSCPSIDPRLLNFTTNHGWMVIPSGKADDESSVASQSTCKWYIENTAQKYWNKYVPLCASAGGVSEREINREQEQNEYTMTLSAGALNTGTSFKKLDHQIWLTESSSYTEFWQTVGRLFEMNPGKDIVPVILPTWNMYVSMFTELALYTQKPGQTLPDVTKIMLDMLPGIDWNGEPCIVDYSSMIKQQLANNLRGASWKNPAIVNINNVSNLSKTDRDSIPDMKDPSKATNRETDVNGKNKEHNKGSNVKIEVNGKKTTSKTDKSTAEKINNFMKHIPAVIANSYIAGYICKDYNDLLTVPSSYWDSYVCKNAQDHFKWFVNQGLVDTNEVDKRIELERQTLEAAFVLDK